MAGLMTNIFADLDNLSTNDLRVELALINNINFTNMARETGNRVIGALAKMASGLIQNSSQGESFGYEVTKMSDMVKDRYNELAGITREELKSSIRSICMERCRLLLPTGQELSEEKASYMIISEAARMYGIARYASFANKIHEISIYYNKDLIQAVHDMLKKQTVQEAESFNTRLQQRLDIISLDAKRELSKRLFPKEFSGRGIANVLRAEKGTRYLEIAVSIMGIECFDYMSAYAVASASSFKKFNNMRRSVYAQLVWKIYGITEDYKTKLPSYINTLKVPDIVKHENEFRQMLKNRVEADKELERLNTQLEKNTADKEKMVEKLSAMQEACDKAKQEFEELEKDKEIYMSGVRPEAETKRYYSQVNAVKRRVDTSEQELNTVQKKYDDLLYKDSQLETAITQKEAYSKQLREQTNVELNAVTSKLKKRWNEFYTRIIFGEDVYGQAVLAFVRNELLCIEQVLLEFMELNDKTALDAEAGVIYVSISENATAKIKHDGITVLEITR